MEISTPCISLVAAIHWCARKINLHLELCRMQVWISRQRGISTPCVLLVAPYTDPDARSTYILNHLNRISGTFSILSVFSITTILVPVFPLKLIHLQRLSRWIYCLQRADEGIQLFQIASVPDHHLHEMNIYTTCMDSGFFQLACFLHICILGNILPACALPISNKHRGAGRRNVWGMVATTYWWGCGIA